MNLAASINGYDGQVPNVDVLSDEYPWSTKIIVQYNRKDNKLYGLSAMPCFILVCDITENFDNSSYFAGLKIQHDKKTKSKIIGKFTINSTNGKHIHFGYA